MGLRIDHVQLAIPAGGEPRAAAFYGEGLGLIAMPKPPALAVRGGAWFEGPLLGGEAVRIHLGVDPDFRPARKAHPALVVADLDEVAARLAGSGFPVRFDEELVGIRRAFVDDPYGNRIELVEAGTVEPGAVGRLHPTLRDATVDDAWDLTDVQWRAVRIGAADHYDEAQRRVWLAAPTATAAVEQRLVDGRATVVAEVGGRIVGYIDLEPDGHVDQLFCRPEVLGRGVGSALVAAVVERARALGLPAVYVEASDGARPAFARHGFELGARRDFIIDGVAIHNHEMRRPLG